MCSPPMPSRSASSRATFRSAHRCSLFMLPILAVGAFFVLRGVTRRTKEMARMSATTAGNARRRGVAARARRQQRRWALWGSYGALAVFVIIFLVPPFYTLMTSLKSSAEIGAQKGNPWLVASPDPGEFLVADHLPELPALLPEFGDGHRAGGRRQHGDLGAGGVQPGAAWASRAARPSAPACS